ncbi:DUF2971 domain-containing protein [Methylophaga thiooxydans]|uniref:DUF2971 domain-containing protein n=1 Tax=Methylophaga thiooxydans DMS010 TaxID=637616 RepID=C0N9L8_9GAMM|nr:DUF2971 domain-containing protein [Methylophaga thiooxydans]EEF78583.1 hypothetical protein MDMS009_2756 [Methylophaga thiooxydans DMS010]
MAKIYKYLGPDILDKAFADEGFCSFKCSYPNEFNDPYELFLTIDYNQPPDILAHYNEVIGEIPQIPTTCFSTSPEVVPMWAHYAHNHCGVVVEIDEEKVLESFPAVRFDDVEYRDEPAPELLDMLYRAAHIGKPRYHYFLQSGVLNAAYFTKQSCWSYEMERRLLIDQAFITKLENGLQLFKIPQGCVTALITGHQATRDTIEQVKSLSEKIGADQYEFRIGRSSSRPYFIALDGSTLLFDTDSLVKASSKCEKCSEPTKNTNLCPWCSVQSQHQNYAAGRNPLRMMQHFGMLEDYYKSMDEIGRK